MSRSGYAGLEKKLLTEQGKSKVEESILPSTLWKKARTSTTGECTNEELQSVVARMDELEASGSIDPWHIIATTTGIEEHPGRQRGVGLEKTKTDMKLPHNPCKKNSVDSKLEAMSAVIFDLQQQIKELRGGIAPSPNSHEVPLVDSARDSCTTNPRMSTLPGGQHKCELLALSPPVVIARGQVLIPAATITTQERMHGRPLLENQRRVMVDKAVVPDAPLPLPTEEFQVVNDAVASFVPWPVNLIRLINGKEKKSKGRVETLKKATGNKGKTIKTGASVTPPVTEQKAAGDGDGGGRSIASLSWILYWFDNIFEGTYLLEVAVPVEIVGHNAIALVDKACVNEINSQTWMSTTALLVYIKYLAIEARKLDALDMFQMVDTQLLSESYAVESGRRLNELWKREKTS